MKTRRRFIAAAGTASLAVVAGCLEGDSDTGTEDTTDDTSETSANITEDETTSDDTTQNETVEDETEDDTEDDYEETIEEFPEGLSEDGVDAEILLQNLKDLSAENSYRLEIKAEIEENLNDTHLEVDPKNKMYLDEEILRDRGVVRNSEELLLFDRSKGIGYDREEDELHIIEEHEYFDNPEKAIQELNENFLDCFSGIEDYEFQLDIESSDEEMFVYEAESYDGDGQPVETLIVPDETVFENALLYVDEEGYISRLEGENTLDGETHTFRAEYDRTEPEFDFGEEIEDEL